MNIADELRKAQQQAREQGEVLTMDSILVLVEKFQQVLDDEITILHGIIDKFHEGSDLIETTREDTFSYREGIKSLEQARKDIKQLNKNKADMTEVVNTPSVGVA